MTGEYCHFPSTWQPGGEGTCDAQCTDDHSCGVIGQQCHDYDGTRRCYTNADCDPANNNADCPPAEVCAQATYACTWPPDICYFTEQCPQGWVCDSNGVCIDPADVCSCADVTDCESNPACQPFGCMCIDCACVVGCGEPTPFGDAICGVGRYCTAGGCQPATPCTGPTDCTPFGLECRDDYCGNP